MTTHQYLRAALVLTAAGVLGLSGCVTKRDIADVNARLDLIKIQNNQVLQAVERMDSTVAAGAEADRKLRADLGTSIYDLQQQMNKLIENYNDLMQRFEQMRTSKKTIIGSSPGASVPTVDTVTAPGGQMADIDCQNSYDNAFILVRRGDYELAVAGFQRYLADCPKHSSAENANYWIGECYYSLEKYTEAIAQFESLLKEYKASANTSRALYKLGRSQQELGKRAEARKVFQRIIDEFPNTLEAEQSKERLKELK